MLIFTLKKEWYEKIKSGEKTIEYREVKPYWNLRINKEFHLYQLPRDKYFRNRCAIRGYGLFTDFTYGLKVANRPLPICKLRLGYTNRYLTATITKIEIVDGNNSDLHINKPVYAIHLANIREEKQVDLTKEISTCPYCGGVLYFHQNEFYCPDCRRAFASVTGDEIKQ